MAASRLDLRWDRGGDWEIRVRRRTRSGVVLAVAEPSLLEVRPVDCPSTVAATLTLPGVAEDDGGLFLGATREQIDGLGADRWEHRVVVTDAGSGRPLVLLRGYVLLIDNAGGP